jgi:hypothetical protein
MHCAASQDRQAVGTMHPNVPVMAMLGVSDDIVNTSMIMSIQPNSTHQCNMPICDW